MATLILKISDEQHTKIKTMAALNKQSMKDFVLDHIFSKNEPNQQTLEAFEELEKDKNTFKKYNNFSDILKEIDA